MIGLDKIGKTVKVTPYAEAYKSKDIMREMVQEIINDFKHSGHRMYISKITNPAFNYSLNMKSEETVDFEIVDLTRGIDIRMKCTDRDKPEAIRVYLMNYKRKPATKNDYNYLLFS